MIMNFQTLFWILPLLLIGFISTCQGEARRNETMEGELLNHIMDPKIYDKRVRPKNESTHRVRVELSVRMIRIISLDDRLQELRWVGYVQAVWNNPYLTWDPDSWGGVHTLYMKETDMWVPDICILERLDDDIGFKDQKRRLIQVNHHGDIRWWLGGDVIATSCNMNVKKFPFDEQDCYMSVGSYVMANDEIEIVDDGGSAVTEYRGKNALWSVGGSSTDIKNYSYYTDPHGGKHDYKYLVFTVKLKRKSGYFVMNIITPSLLMSLLMCVVFLLPPGGGEKIGFAITLLLAFNVIQLVITDSMPQTSESMSIVAFYITTLTAVSAASIPLSAITIYIHFNGYNWIPKRIRTILFHGCKSRRKQNMKEEFAQNSNHIDVYPQLTKYLNNQQHTSSMDNMDNNGDVMTKQQEQQRELEWEIAAKQLDKKLLKFFVIVLILITCICMVVLACLP